MRIELFQLPGLKVEVETNDTATLAGTSLTEDQAAAIKGAVMGSIMRTVEKLTLDNGYVEEDGISLIDRLVGSFRNDVDRNVGEILAPFIANAIRNVPRMN